MTVIVRRRPTGVALAVVVALLLAACGATSAPPAPATAVEDVRSMLRARARLLVDKDVAGYLRPVTGEARTLEEAIARGAAAVPLAFVNATFNPSGRAEPDATEFRDAELELVFGYEGFPKDNRFRFALRYDLELIDGLWTITASRHEPQPGVQGVGEAEEGSAAADAEARFENRLPLPVWARFPLEATQSEHFLVLHPPGLAEAAQVVELAEQARAQLAPRLRFGSADTIQLVVVARDRDEYEAFLEADRGADSVALVSLIYIPFAPPEGRQMIVNLDRVLGRDERLVGHSGAATSVEILQHELAHLALSRVDSLFTPSWVQEGAAMYLAGERRLDEWTDGLADGTFADVSVTGFGEDTNLSRSADYAYVNAAVSYLVAEFGAERFWDFYVRFQPVVDSVVSDDSVGNFVVESVYGIDLPELDRRTREWMAAAVAAA